MAPLASRARSPHHPLVSSDREGGACPVSSACRFQNNRATVAGQILRTHISIARDTVEMVTPPSLGLSVLASRKIWATPAATSTDSGGGPAVPALPLPPPGGLAPPNESRTPCSATNAKNPDVAREGATLDAIILTASAVQFLARRLRGRGLPSPLPPTKLGGLAGSGLAPLPCLSLLLLWLLPPADGSCRSSSHCGSGDARSLPS